MGTHRREKESNKFECFESLSLRTLVKQFPTWSLYLGTQCLDCETIPLKAMAYYIYLFKPLSAERNNSEHAWKCFNLKTLEFAMSLGDQHGSHQINLIDFYMSLINIHIVAISYRNVSRGGTEHVTSEAEISGKPHGLKAPDLCEIIIASPGVPMTWQMRGSLKFNCPHWRNQAVSCPG